MEKRVAIVGAGISGLLACKYAVAKGLRPIVFEAQDCVGGLWTHTIESTKLQNPKEAYQFTDFPWPSSVKETFPHNTQVLEYIQSYAQHFCLIRHIKFNSKVISIDYIGESHEEIQSWDQWGGTGKAFGSRGKWTVKVQHTKENLVQDYMVEFIILCIGRFSGLPNIPEFHQDHGPEVFDGKVLHSMDFSAMDNASAEEFIKGKKVAIVGSSKSAADIANECAIVNDGGISKFAESYLRWKLPLKKYKMIPPHSFLQDMSSCRVLMMPENFYERVEEGSIILKKFEGLSFCREGLILDGESHPLKADIVIFATGYRGDQKITNIFSCPTFQKYIMGAPTSVLPLYRQIIHPRIPQLAVIGYSESISNLQTSETRCQWLAHFLDQTFQLPSIKEMEKDVLMWEKYMKLYAGEYYRRSSIGALHIWYNDQLCKDIGCSSRRKKGFFLELFEPFGPADYKDLNPQA